MSTSVEATATKRRGHRAQLTGPNALPTAYSAAHSDMDDVESASSCTVLCRFDMVVFHCTPPVRRRTLSAKPYPLYAHHSRNKTTTNSTDTHRHTQTHRHTDNNDSKQKSEG